MPERRAGPGAPPLVRCRWVPEGDALYRTYHDEEWGVPEKDGPALFRALVLDGFQAGLSWRTILHKRAHILEVTDGLDPQRVALYGPGKLDELMGDPRIVRNRLKLAAAVKNAQAYLQLAEGGVSFSDFLWDFVGGAARIAHFEGSEQVPARTAESDAMSRALRRAGFSFVGSTTCYAFMQACGLVMDHTTDCFRHKELSGG